MGEDKARLVLSSNPSHRLVDVAAQQLALACDEVVLVGGPDHVDLCPVGKDGEPLEVTSIVDAGDGPLQALAPFLSAPGQHWTTLTVVPVDMPGVLATDLLTLIDAAVQAKATAHFVAEGDSPHNSSLSLPVCIHQSARGVLGERIAAGERRLAKTLAAIDTVGQTIGRQAAAFTLANINTPQELQAFEARAKRLQGGTVASRVTEVTRIHLARPPDGEGRTTVSDRVAEEEPLEIRVHGVSVAITMRTPGHDLELVRGFLWTEGIVTRPADIVHLEHCERVEDPEAEDNIVDVRLAPGVDLDLQRLQRHTFAHSSCGICGKATLEAALQTGSPVEDARTLSAQRVTHLPETLRLYQGVFEQTGGLHAAGLLASASDRGLSIVREDVGRHNAIDKVVGASLASAEGNRGEPALALVVSGRVSFEVVQKAARARWPILVAISAPTSLAVRLADTLGITLVGFVRNHAMNVYTHPHRVTR